LGRVCIGLICGIIGLFILVGPSSTVPSQQMLKLCGGDYVGNVQAVNDCCDSYNGLLVPACNGPGACFVCEVGPDNCPLVYVADSGGAVRDWATYIDCGELMLGVCQKINEEWVCHPVWPQGGACRDMPDAHDGGCLEIK